jgi:DNA-binding CsgD family transcriptional regulator
MRFRLLEPRDIPTCCALLNPALALTPRTIKELPAVWLALAAFGTLSIVEDPQKAFPDSIQGFGASVFVNDDFVDEFMAGRRNYLDAALYERILTGPSPVLSEEQIADANSGDGLNLIVLNYGLRDHDLANPETQRVVQVGTAAFFTLHLGYRVKVILNEVFGETAAQYLAAGGFRRQGPAPASNADGNSPHLFALRREWVQPGVVDTLSTLFHAPRPQIGFSAGEQRVLRHALLNRTDTEIASLFGMSPDGVKKAWRRIYDRVSRKLPYLTADDRTEGTAGRSTEKRRHVLEYVRTHPEEVRPTSRGQR